MQKQSKNSPGVQYPLKVYTFMVQVSHLSVKIFYPCNGGLKLEKDYHKFSSNHWVYMFFYGVNGSQLAKMKKSIPDMSLP